MEPTSEVGVRNRVRRGSGTGSWDRVRGSLIPSPGMAIPGSRIRRIRDPRIDRSLFAIDVDRCYRAKAMLDLVHERSSSDDREFPRAEPRARDASERPRCDAVMVLADAELGRIFKT